MKQKVSLIVKPGYESLINSIANKMHVWVIDIPEYIEELQKWYDETKLDGTFTNGGSYFQSNPNLRPDQIAIDILETIDDHHGASWTEETGEIEEWSEIEIYGTEITEELKQALFDYDITVIQQNKNGLNGKR